MKKCKLKDSKYIKDFNLDLDYLEKLSNYNKEKQEVLKKQNLEYGFDERETYSLYHCIAIFIYTRLKMMLEVSKDIVDYDHPMEKNYKEDIEKMLFTFENIIKTEDIEYQLDTDEEFKEKFYEGFDAFKRSFFKLWW